MNEYLAVEARSRFGGQWRASSAPSAFDDVIVCTVEHAPDGGEWASVSFTVKPMRRWATGVNEAWPSFQEAFRKLVPPAVMAEVEQGEAMLAHLRVWA